MSLASISTRIRVGEIQSYLRDLNLLGLASALTLFLVIVFGFEHWITKIIANALFVAALVFPALLRHHLFWLILALSSSIALAADWYVSDNHKYLLVYWLWVMWISHLQPTREEAENVLRWHARFFLIFIFLVAAAQKFFSPTYMSGEMFELKLLLDGRFKAFGHLIGIDRVVSDEAVKFTLVLRSPLSEVEGNALILNSTDWTARVAKLITWYDLFIQIAIGLLFMPKRYHTDLAGHVLLLFFIFTTYLPAPVFGFGWTIAILGLVTAFNRINSLLYWYFAAFLGILCYQIPWREWVLA
jgi:hypothetical protein